MIKLYSYSQVGSLFEVPVKFWTFPAGERGVKIEKTACFLSEKVRIDISYKSSDDIIDLILLVDALRDIHISNIELVIKYFPYARQDRKCNAGESFSLRAIAEVIKFLNFNSITVYDPHSTVLEGMFPAGILNVVTQDKLVIYTVPHLDNYILCSPDAGALKKIYKFYYAGYKNPVIEAGKVRELSTGKIVRTCITQGPGVNTIKSGQRILVVDDICDGGATFIELAKVLQKEYPEIPLDLYVTHGIFSKGKDELNKYYDKIYCFNDLSVIE